VQAGLNAGAYQGAFASSWAMDSDGALTDRNVNYATAGDGVRIAWRSDGRAEAAPLLLCSMATAALGVWDPILARLAERRRVIRYDRRGDGDSDPGAPESHAFATYLADAERVLDAAGCAAADVAGMAFGARVATQLALNAPGRVRSLILFDATAGPAAPEPMRRAGSEEAARLRDAAGLPKAPIQREWFARRNPAGAGLSSLALKGLPDWTPGLADITAPTFIACGEQDPNLEGSRRMATEIPGAEFHLMPMTGHASLLDRPDLVAALMLQALDRA
jgi:pimeloyl-ACP methyl ester carboxylesterase